MAEDIDIDIEEHDLLQNPIIKSIFPDLSVLKQEVIDFDEVLPENAGNPVVTNSNILMNKLKNTDVSSTSTQFNVACDFRTKIILGSKPSKATNKLKNDVKVVLENITPFLTQTRFCDTCLILFPNSESLNSHKLSIHRIINNSSSKDFLICPEKNIGMVITYNHLKKPCFHCNKLFPNQQDLIDHLYSILYAKKMPVSLDNVKEKNKPLVERPVERNNITSQKHICENSDEQIQKDRKVSETKNIFSCPICSYYFNDENVCRKHVIGKHQGLNNMQVYKSSFKPKCKFCDVKLLNIMSYNTHLRKKHEIEMLKKVNSVLSFNNIGIRQCYRNLPLPGCSPVDLYSKKITELKQSFKKHDHLNPIYDHIQVVVSKIMLFQCSECDIHFLTSDAAFKHFAHIKFHETWECTNCHRLFKSKDAITHQKQHKYSNYFRIIKVFAEIQSRILYRCSICGVCYGKEFFLKHCCTCESEQTQSSESSYCKICDIFIGSCTKLSHQNDHNVRNFTQTDFQIIVSESPFLKNDVKNCGHNYQNQVKPYTQESILDIEKHVNTNHNRKHNNVLKISKRVFVKKHLTYNYCDVCKCNICKVYKTDVHLKLLCVNIVKYICKYCGLMFSNKSITSHKRLHHKYKTLKLQDFKFYNLQTNKVMTPLIPEFPKCELCEKHFISKVEAKGHICDTNDYLKCSICKSKYSKTAYKLHMPFHSYNLKNKNLPDELINNEKSYLYSIENIKSNISMDTIIPIIYTCKNCNLSINTYDEVIEHCHLHTNLNKVEVNGVECEICDLKFANSSYNQHKDLHKDFGNVHFTHFYFDVVYFGSDNNKWLKHIFKSLPKHKVDTFIRDSIYKNENRIKMAVIQEGPSNLIIYKCEKCQCIIDSNSIYNHIAICCPSSEISDCTFCDLSFACSMTRNKHEKIHAISDITIKSYRIVIFNREQDRSINNNISNLKKCYVVYECRYCHVLVENYSYIYHVCFRNDAKKCYVCGLLVSAENLNAHILKHKLVPSFNENKIKVILLGSQIQENNILQSNNGLISTFSGIVCDYTFYKCIDCEVCVRDVRNTVQHSCLIGAAKSQCIKCDLIFDEGKLKGHLKLHNTDPDFTKETILVKLFTNRKPVISNNIRQKLVFNTDTEKYSKNNNENIKQLTSFNTITNQTKVISKIAKLYKCVCGLHYIQQSSLQEHIKKCSGKNKNSQNCSKCCLTFTSDVLFKHLLEHHGDKNVVFKYEIVENPS